MSNTWYEPFSYANTTDLVGQTVPGTYTGGAVTYANLTNQTLIQAVITSDAPYSATSGSFAWAIAPVTMGLNDPVSLTFQYRGATASTGFAGVAARVQSGGICVYADISLNTCRVNIAWANGSGTKANLQQSTAPASVMPSDTYILTLCPWYNVFNAYVQSATTGLWWNPATAAMQATKIAAVSCANNTFSTAGYAGFFTACKSGDTNAPVISLVQGGPGILLPADLGCRRVGDVFNEITLRSAEGGTQPVSYIINRSPHGAGTYTRAGGATQAQVTNGFTLIDPTAASTAYDYQVVVTDSTGGTPLTATNGPLSITTHASLGLSPYTLGTPTVSTFVNGFNSNDTSGRPFGWWDAGVWYDAALGQYIVCSAYRSSGGGQGTGVSGYMSADLLNATPFGNAAGTGGLQLITSTVNGITYNSVGEPRIIAHPTDGNYYLLAIGDATSTGQWLLVHKSTTGPMGPYSYLAALNNGSSTVFGDVDYLVDDDGTIWAWTSGATSVYPINASMTSLGTPVNILAGTVDAYGVARRDKFIYLHTSYGASQNNGWGLTPGFAGIYAAPARAGYTYPSTVVNTTGDHTTAMYSTPAQAVAAPAGGIASLGYGGVGSGTSSAYGYTGGTQTGWDANDSYQSQSRALYRALTGEWHALTDRWDAGGSYASTAVDMILSFDSSQQPILPMTSVTIPKAGYLSLSGPSSGTVGTPSSAFSVSMPFATADTITFSDNGAGGTFSHATVTSTLPTGTFATVTYTASSTAPVAIAATSANGYPLLSGITYAAAAGGGPFPFFTDQSHSGGCWDGGL